MSLAFPFHTYYNISGGEMQGNTVVIEDDDLKNYDGAEVVATFLNYKQKGKSAKPAVDWDSFAIPSERGKDVEGYMREMRDNDRI